MCVYHWIFFFFHLIFMCKKCSLLKRAPQLCVKYFEYNLISPFFLAVFFFTLNNGSIINSSEIDKAIFIFIWIDDWHILMNSVRIKKGVCFKGYRNVKKKSQVYLLNDFYCRAWNDSSCMYWKWKTKIIIYELFCFVALYNYTAWFFGANCYFAEPISIML